MKTLKNLNKLRAFNGKFILLMFTGLVLTSCEDYLDVSPSSEIKEDDLFSNEQGYQDALYGVYQQMAQEELYGDNLTLGFLEVLAQQYDTRVGGHIFFNSSLYRYEDNAVESRIDSIYSQMYTAIAQTNFILKDIDANQEVFTSGLMYDVVKGEALGLRGFMHLDLVRLFGSSPATADGSPAIPYMEEFTVRSQERLSVAEVLEESEEDLLAAETLLESYPQMDEIRNPAGELGSVNNFLAFRQNRMNYWAVKAALARLYLYKGDEAKALTYATEVINSGHFRFMTQEELNTTGAFNDRTFSYEHIFSLNVSELRDISDDYFRVSTNTNAGMLSKLIVAEPKVDNIYEIAQGYSSDPRYDKLWQYSQSVLVPAKFWQDDFMSPLISNLVPVIRLSEMYYIAAETEPKTTTAVEYLNTVRRARFIPELPTDIDAATLDTEIFKEYRKEFVGEGQLFYYYKRKNATNIIDSPVSSITNQQYVLPIPLREIEFGVNSSDN